MTAVSVGSSFYAFVFLVLIESLLCENETPMVERLANDWTDRPVINRGVGIKNLIAELASKSTRNSSRFCPSTDLAFVISGSATLKISTVPLKPAIWVNANDPSTALPHPQTTTAFHTVFVHFRVVVLAAKLLAYRETFDPLFRKLTQNLGTLVPQACDGGVDGTKVSATKTTLLEHLHWGEVRPESGAVLENVFSDTVSCRWRCCFGEYVSVWWELRRVLVQILFVLDEEVAVPEERFREVCSV